MFVGVAVMLYYGLVTAITINIKGVDSLGECIVEADFRLTASLYR